MAVEPQPEFDAWLAQARKALPERPREALASALAVLRRAPAHAEARLLAGAARRRLGDPVGARDDLVALAGALPRAWGVQFEAGAALAMLGDGGGASTYLGRAITLNPRSSLAWHALGDQRAITGDRAGAEAAFATRLPGSVHDPALRDAAAAFVGADPADAAARPRGERLRDGFNLHVTDPVALRLIADAAAAAGRTHEAASLLRRVVEATPTFLAARHALAAALLRIDAVAQAQPHVEALVEAAPGTAALRVLRAALAVGDADYDQALDEYAAALAIDPQAPRVWLSRGHVLKTVGRGADAAAAYRRSLDLEPRQGEAYWSLANLKVERFRPAEIAAMTALSTEGDLDPQARAHLHFALGKALEDEQRYGESFEHYRRGNALRRAERPYDAQSNDDFVQRSTATFTPEFFRARRGFGDLSPDPIFIVGLPRSGSTLVEQILSCHSEVEGLSELPDLVAQARAIAAGGDYLTALTRADAPRLATAGSAYLACAARRRKLGRVRFVDKFPTNFLHVGLIQVILPNAIIIDVRRDAIACCFSGFKQNYAAGQDYSYDLSDIGRYYVSYVRLITHFDAVAPGRVARVDYEDLVRDPEGVTRRLLRDCRLEFEPACLRPQDSRRPVRTASAEQVRRPISAQGIDDWRRYDAWLDPLKDALGAELLAKP